MAWDDLTGATLDPREVSKARLKELRYINDKSVYKKMPRREAVSKGIRILKTKWIDTNTGDLEHPNYRSRFVAMEFNTHRMDGLFASTPPLEALKLLLSDAATVGSMARNSSKEEKAVMVNDVARAFFEAPISREVAVELPVEDGGRPGSEMVGLLQKSLYGTRDAAANFQREVKKLMWEQGFVVGAYNVSTFYHRQRGLRVMVHGDDFISTRCRESLSWMKCRLEERFEVKTTLIGHRKGEALEGRVLNTIIRACTAGWEYEGDQRHAELVVGVMDLKSANTVTTPGEDAKKEKEEEESRLLEENKATMFRQLAARANYMAMDSADIQFAVEEIFRSVANPTIGSWRQLKRLARYLKKRFWAVATFDFQERSRIVDGYSDSDWDGCRRTARSTSGGALMIGNHLIKSWSSTQMNITLSSAEAELVVSVKVCGGTIGLVQLAADWRLDMKWKTHVDSSAAIGLAHRRGNGKLRHVKVGSLWIQELVEEEEILICKVPGAENIADILTKHVGASLLHKHAANMGIFFPLGRAESGLHL